MSIEFVMNLNSQQKDLSFILICWFVHSLNFSATCQPNYHEKD